MKLHVLLLSLALGGCAIFDAAETPAQKVYAARVVYEVALDGANRYAALPRCIADAPVVQLCSNANIVDALYSAQMAADAVLDGAERTVLNPDLGQDTLNDAAILAENAANVFLSFSSKYDLQ